jgi:23S rRNA pseudouridine1911/1915/1917 synthase
MSRNEGHDYVERLAASADGETLIAYLARRYRHSSREDWVSRILDERVLIDSLPATPDTVLRNGQILVWRRPPWDEPEAPRSFAVLLEDEELLAVAKPAGLPTLPGSGFLRSTLLNRVRAVVPEASPVHRLGRWTSGVVLFAKSPEAGAVLSRQWASRSVRKRYRGLAGGRPRRSSFTVDAAIGPVPHHGLGSVHAASPDGKPADSRVEVLEQRRDAFVCDVFIATGRPHQVRIHLAVAGHPLVGDPLYPPGGVPEPESEALPGDPGYALHAAELGFRHPRTGVSTTVECAPPPDLRTAPRGA